MEHTPPTTTVGPQPPQDSPITRPLHTPHSSQRGKSIQGDEMVQLNLDNNNLNDPNKPNNQNNQNNLNNPNDQNNNNITHNTQTIDIPTTIPTTNDDHLPNPSKRPRPNSTEGHLNLHLRQDDVNNNETKNNETGTSTISTTTIPSSIPSISSPSPSDSNTILAQPPLMNTNTTDIATQISCDNILVADSNVQQPQNNFNQQQNIQQEQSIINNNQQQSIINNNQQQNNHQQSVNNTNNNITTQSSNSTTSGIHTNTITKPPQVFRPTKFNPFRFNSPSPVPRSDKTNKINNQINSMTTITLNQNKTTLPMTTRANNTATTSITSPSSSTTTTINTTSTRPQLSQLSQLPQLPQPELSQLPQLPQLPQPQFLPPQLPTPQDLLKRPQWLIKQMVPITTLPHRDRKRFVDGLNALTGTKCDIAVCLGLKLDQNDHQFEPLPPPPSLRHFCYTCMSICENRRSHLQQHQLYYAIQEQLFEQMRAMKKTKNIKEILSPAVLTHIDRSNARMRKNNQNDENNIIKDAGDDEMDIQITSGTTNTNTNPTSQSTLMSDSDTTSTNSAFIESQEVNSNVQKLILLMIEKDVNNSTYSLLDTSGTFLMKKVREFDEYSSTTGFIGINPFTNLSTAKDNKSNNNNSNSRSSHTPREKERDEIINDSLTNPTPTSRRSIHEKHEKPSKHDKHNIDKNNQKNDNIDNNNNNNTTTSNNITNNIPKGMEVLIVCDICRYAGKLTPTQHHIHSYTHRSLTVRRYANINKIKDSMNTTLVNSITRPSTFFTHLVAPECDKDENDYLYFGLNRYTQHLMDDGYQIYHDTDTQPNFIYTLSPYTSLPIYDGSTVLLTLDAGVTGGGSQKLSKKIAKNRQNLLPPSGVNMLGAVTLNSKSTDKELYAWDFEPPLSMRQHYLGTKTKIPYQPVKLPPHLTTENLYGVKLNQLEQQQWDSYPVIQERIPNGDYSNVEEYFVALNNALVLNKMEAVEKIKKMISGEIIGVEDDDNHNNNNNNDNNNNNNNNNHNHNPTKKTIINYTPLNSLPHPSPTLCNKDTNDKLPPVPRDGYLLPPSMCMHAENLFIPQAFRPYSPFQRLDLRTNHPLGKRYITSSRYGPLVAFDQPGVNDGGHDVKLFNLLEPLKAVIPYKSLKDILINLAKLSREAAEARGVATVLTTPKRGRKKSIIKTPPNKIEPARVNTTTNKTTSRKINPLMSNGRIGGGKNKRQLLSRRNNKSTRRKAKCIPRSKRPRLLTTYLNPLDLLLSSAMGLSTTSTGPGRRAANSNAHSQLNSLTSPLSSLLQYIQLSSGSTERLSSHTAEFMMQDVTSGMFDSLSTLAPEPLSKKSSFDFLAFVQQQNRRIEQYRAQKRDILLKQKQYKEQLRNQQNQQCEPNVKNNNNNNKNNNNNNNNNNHFVNTVPNKTNNTNTNNQKDKNVVPSKPDGLIPHIPFVYNPQALHALLNRHYTNGPGSTMFLSSIDGIGVSNHHMNHFGHNNSHNNRRTGSTQLYTPSQHNNYGNQQSGSFDASSSSTNSGTQSQYLQLKQQRQLQQQPQQQDNEENNNNNMNDEITNPTTTGPTRRGGKFTKKSTTKAEQQSSTTTTTTTPQPRGRKKATVTTTTPSE